MSGRYKPRRRILTRREDLKPYPRLRVQCRECYDAGLTLRESRKLCTCGRVPLRTR
jgi:hypothetical protein